MFIIVSFYLEFVPFILFSSYQAALNYAIRELHLYRSEFKIFELTEKM